MFYAFAAIALIGAIACFAKKLLVAKIVGLIFAIMGLYSLISAQLSQDTFSLYNCLEMLLGVAIFVTASKK